MPPVSPVHISFLLPAHWEMLSLKSWLYSAIEKIGLPTLGIHFLHPLEQERKLSLHTLMNVEAQIFPLY